MRDNYRKSVDFWTPSLRVEIVQEIGGLIDPFQLQFTGYAVARGWSLRF